MPDIRAKVIEKNPNAVKQSWQWYQTHVRDAAAGMNAQKFLGANQAHQVTKILPGQMLAFGYDPKTKDKLPYYDTFPLVFPFAVDNKHFMGLNLHYMQPKLRMVLLDKLMAISTSNASKTNKLIFSYQSIKAISGLPQVSHCVKKYLFGYVKSRFIMIPQSDWQNVIWLPLCRFKKQSAEYVWAQANKKVNT